MIGRITARLVQRLEREIAPPMRQAYTIPVQIDGRDRGVMIYVGVSAFAPGYLAPADLLAIATRVVSGIEDVKLDREAP